jgi:hypothetical protein
VGFGVGCGCTFGLTFCTGVGFGGGGVGIDWIAAGAATGAGLISSAVIVRDSIGLNGAASRIVNATASATT